MATYSVKLRVYDLSRGMVKTWSPLLIGKQIQGVWHTSVLVYDMEYFYGGGILCLEPKEFEKYYDLKPVDTLNMGETEVNQTYFHEYINGIQKDFTVDKYNLINWNCNHFTNEVCNFLVGTNIPQYILNTPYEVMSTSKGKLILDMMQSYQNIIAPGLETNSSENNKQTVEHKNVDKEEDEKKEFSKLQSVTMDNFFDNNNIENLLEEFMKSDKHDSNQKKNFLNILNTFLNNIEKNINIFKYRVLYKKSYDIFNSLHTISEYNKSLSYIGFFDGFVENDEINNLQNFTIFIDSKNKAHSFHSENLDLFINKKIFFKNENKCISKTVVLDFKDITDYIPYVEKKKTISNDVFVFISAAFIVNNFDETNEKNDINYFNNIQKKINADLNVEKKKLLSVLEVIKKKHSSLSA